MLVVPPAARGRAPARAPTPAAPAAPAAPARALGPLDLAAAKLDLAAAFPGAAVVLHPAEDPGQGGTELDTYTVPTVTVKRGDQAVLELELEGQRVTTIRVYDKAIVNAAGIHPGSPPEDLAKARPDTMCRRARLESMCHSEADPEFTYALDDDAAVEGDDPEDPDVPIAKVAGGTIARVDWSPLAGKGPELAAMPAAAATGTEEQGAEPDGEDWDRAPTAEEIDRCAILRGLSRACGWGYDPEFGWMKRKPENATAKVARKECTLDTIADDNGWQLPVPLYDAKVIEALTAAHTAGGCKAFRAELEKHGMVNDQVP
jgi:hypothetical protein